MIDVSTTAVRQLDVAADPNTTPAQLLRHMADTLEQFHVDDWHELEALAFGVIDGGANGQGDCPYLSAFVHDSIERSRIAESRHG